MSVCIKSLIKNRNIVIGCTNRCPYCYARINCARYHMTDDFSIPYFYEGKLRLFDSKKPGTFLLTGMSDFADWKSDWNQKIFDRIAMNPQHDFLFLTKSPERIHFESPLPNVWMGVTVTDSADKIRIRQLKENIKVGHYHVTFEPLHNSVGELDLHGIDWIVIGTETGKRRNKIDAKIEWVEEIVQQAQALHIPIFMKEELAKVIGEESMIQEMPQQFAGIGRFKK